MKHSIRLSKVDFSKSWWWIIVKQPMLLLMIVCLVLCRDLFSTFEPFLIAMVLEYQNWYFFGGACLLWLLAELNLIIFSLLNPRFQLGVIHSALYSTHQQLLVIDPLYHVKRSSGAVLAKIERASRGYEDILDQITFDFAPLCIGIISMLLVFSHYSYLLTSAVAMCLFSMIFYAFYFACYICQEKENEFIRTDDDFKATAFENLAQIQLVRATFATDYMRDNLTRKTIINSETEEKLWRSYSLVSRVLYAIYAISIIFLTAFFMHKIKLNAMSLAQAIGITLAYLTSTRQLLKIVLPMRKFIRGYVAVQDLFESMRKFGKQTIPIFEDGVSPAAEKYEPFSIKAYDLVFGYSSAKMFDRHAIEITSDGISRPNNLYGIIGPSGVGKTTLLSILGGQLKPLHGTVMINDIDIYAVGDAVRRQLIALQGQIATSVKGSVRYNLLFGLPENHGYTDEYLLEVLDKVGLKTVLQDHQGLDTLLGEGALNISGGQRQRLNFAGLYLRAMFYKPVLILIDEPTSSLDELSEMAVTQMILELASSAITLVIAHRLKTLEQATGLIDLSLLNESKDIRLYSSEELKISSSYYRQLIQGDGFLE